MILAATAIVTNEYDQVLLVEREKGKMWGPPDGLIPIGELPTDAAARETLAATGMKVYPVRLAAATFSPAAEGGTLHLIIRCLQKGGQLNPDDDDKPRAGFFPALDLPAAMAPEERQRVELAVHQAGPAVLEKVKKSLVNRVTSWLRPNRAAESGKWRVDVWLVAKNRAGEVAVQTQNELPNTTCRPGESPWEAAGRLGSEMFSDGAGRIKISAIFIHPDKPQATFVFFATNPILSSEKHMVSPTTVFLPAGAPSIDALLTHHELPFIGLWQ